MPGPGAHPTDVLIRAGRRGDASALAALHRAARAEAMPWLAVVHTPEEDVAFFGDVVLGTQTVWVAEREGAPVGFAARDDGRLEHLYVAPGAQGRGVGRRLLAAATADGAPLELHVFTRNARARAFYERAGWRLLGQGDGSANEEREPDCRYGWSPPGHG